MGLGYIFDTYFDSLRESCKKNTITKLDSNNKKMRYND